MLILENSVWIKKITFVNSLGSLLFYIETKSHLPNSKSSPSNKYRSSTSIPVYQVTNHNSQTEFDDLNV